MIPEQAPAPQPAERGLAQRALGGLLWTFSGAAAKGVVQILVLMFLARLLAPDDFGVVAAALVVIRLATSISEFGIGPAIIQKPELLPQDVSTAFAFFVVSGAAASALVWLAAPALADFFRMAALERVLMVMAPTILISNAGELASMLLRRRLQFRQIAGALLVSYICGYGLAGVGLAAAGFGLWALVGAFMLQMTLRTILLLLLEPHAKSLRISPRALAQMLRFGGGLVIFRLANEAALQTDKLVVGRWLGAEALGLYGRAHHISATPASFLAQGVLLVLFPVMSKIQQDQARTAQSYRRGIALATLATAPVGVVIAILAPEIVAIVLGDSWHAAALPFAILSLGLTFRISSRVAASIATATAAVYRMAWRQAVYAAAVLAGALLGALGGIAGVAAGMLLAQLVHYGLMAHLAVTLTTLPYKRLLLAHGPGLLVAALIAPLVWLVRWTLLELGAGPLAIVGTATLTAGFALLLVVNTIPHFVLGSDGVWLIEALLARMPRRSRGVIRRLLGRGLAQSAA